MTDREQLAEHFQFLRELGVHGISSDEVWRRPGLSPVLRMNSEVELKDIRQNIGECTRCKLHAGRTNLVFGVGNPNADLMFVGEAPGRDEDVKGEPFVGRAGQLLTKIIEAIDLSRDDVYIANVIKCRPPQNLSLIHI